MVRAMAGRRPRARNEDLAIVTIAPLPGNPLVFDAVDEVVREFCHFARVPVKDVQPCHLGQAFVRFESEFDRDRMVLESPHPYGGVHYSFEQHNQGRNWRHLNFNQECWLMLMGLPPDFWEDEFIDSAVGSFARIISWEGDPECLTRLLIRARVTDLESIPHFSVFSDGPGPAGQSWTLQCEVLQYEQLGADPPDEEQVPPQPQDGPLLYDFFGLGQHVLAPEPGPRHLANDQEQQDGGDIPANQVNQNLQLGWEEWPAPQQHLPPGNHLLVPLAQDLNEEPLDPMEMIVNPAQVDEQEEEHRIAQPPVQNAQPVLQAPDLQPLPVQLNQVPILPVQMEHEAFPDLQLQEEEEMMDLDELQLQVGLNDQPQQLVANEHLEIADEQFQADAQPYQLEDADAVIVQQNIQLGMVMTLFTHTPAPPEPFPLSPSLTGTPPSKSEMLDGHVVIPKA